RQAVGSQPRADVVHSSLYLPEAVYEAFRETAFNEGCKIHYLVMQGVEMALKKRGYPSAEELQAGKKREAPGVAAAVARAGWPLASRLSDLPPIAADLMWRRRCGPFPDSCTAAIDCYRRASVLGGCCPKNVALFGHRGLEPKAGDTQRAPMKSML